MRHDELEDLGEQRARLAAQDTFVRVERDEAVEPAQRDQRAAWVETAVAVAAAVAERQQGRLSGGQDLVRPARAMDALPACGREAPGADARARPG